MANNRLANICKGLLDLLKKEKRVEEEQLYVYWDGMIDLLEIHQDNWPVSYRELSEYVERKWSFRNFDKMSAEEVFLCGSIWGSSKLMKQKALRTVRNLELKDLISKYMNNDNLRILEIVYKTPGIRHKDLAEKIQKSASGLTQTLFPMMKEGLLDYNHMGRENHYYLQPEGEMVYQQVRKLKRKERGVTTDFRYCKRPVNTNDLSGSDERDSFQNFKLVIYPGELKESINNKYFLSFRNSEKIKIDQNELIKGGFTA